MPRLRTAVQATMPVVPGLVTTAILWLAAIPTAYLSRDGGTFAYIGSQVLRGDLPLRDLWDHKPPGIDYLDAIAFVSGAPDLKTLLGLDLIFAVAFVVAMGWALLRAASARTVALVLPWLAIALRILLEGSTNMTEQFAVVPMAIAIGCGLVALRPESRRRVPWGLAAGFFAGLAALFKPVAMSGGLALLLAVTPLLWSDWRAAVRLALAAVAGLAIPLAALIGGYADAGALPILWDTVVVYNKLYAPHLSVQLLAEALVKLISQPIFTPLPLALLIGRLRGLPRYRPVLLFVIVMPALDLAGLIAQGRFYLHDMVLLLPSTGLLLALGLEGVMGPQFDVVKMLPRRWAAAALATILVLLSLPLALSVSVIPLVGGAVRLTAVARSLSSTCPAASSVYIWGAESEVYFLSNRRAASRYIYVYPLQMPSYDNQARVATLLRDLQQSSPCAIVDASTNSAHVVPPLDAAARASWVPSSLFGGAYSYAGFEPIYEYVDQHYHVGMTVAGYSIFLRQ